MRSRNIKPGFFKNEELAEINPIIRLLYIGLWCYADKEGRFEWRPRRIKAEVLPYDNGEITVMLQELNDRGFIKRYSVDENEYGWIVNFCKHQNPHHTEKPSILPSYQGNGEITVKQPLNNGYAPADSLIPDSLIPDSLIPDNYIRDSLTPEEGDSIRPPKAVDDEDTLKGKDNKTPPCPHEEIKSLYHSILPELRAMKAWGPFRRKLLAMRWKEKPERQNLEWWERFFGYVRGCPFLMGQVDNRNGSPPFEADLEWLVRPSNFIKVIEGKYERK